MPPKLNRRRAELVLGRIDAILAWEARHESERDTRFVELGKYLCEVRAGQYWRLENLKSFDDFLAKRFPESRRKAYYLMSIHENLPPQVRKDLKQVGWTKGLELAKLARQQGQRFERATWLHKARRMPKEEFKREVEKELTGKDSEPSELIFFKVHKSQIPVIEQAIETAALMLGTDKSRGYCLEMICADFLAGATSIAKTPRSCCNPSLAITSSCPRRNRRFFCLRSGGKFHDEESRQDPATPAGSQKVPRTAPADLGTGWLAMPVVRLHAKLTSTPLTTTEPLWQRRGTEPDYLMRGLPRAHPSRSSV
jgi:hypothetical protein